MTIYSAENVTGILAGTEIQFRLVKSNHSTSGELSAPRKGYFLFDKITQNLYLIMYVDDKTPYNHKIRIKPTNMAVIATIKKDRSYLLIPSFQMV